MLAPQTWQLSKEEEAGLCWVVAWLARQTSVNSSKGPYCVELTLVISGNGGGLLRSLAMTPEASGHTCFIETQVSFIAE